MISPGRSYFPNLDGLRFFAFLHVFLSHVIIDQFASISPAFKNIKEYIAPGFFGIDMFFVLSGFLITWTLLEERFTKRSMSLRNFLARRTLRIWPLYFLIVACGYGLHYLGVKLGFNLEPLPGIHWFMFFILNFYISIHGPYFLFFMVFLWSIAVEEQFYLLWGFVMKYARRAFQHVCIIVILLSLYFRYTHLSDNNMLVFHSLSVASNLASGALFSYACFYRSELFKTLKALKRGTWVRIYLLLSVLYLLYSQLFNAPVVIVFEKLIFSFLFCLVIFDQCFNDNRPFNAMFSKTIGYLGRISYGLYCFHGLVITFVLLLSERIEVFRTAGFIFFLSPMVIAAFTILLAHLSYRYFEKPFLNYRKVYR